MSSGKYFIGTFMYSDFSVGGARKKPFRSQLKNIAPFSASKIVLLSRMFVYIKLEVGGPVSALYGSISPSNTSCTRHASVLAVGDHIQN